MLTPTVKTFKINTSGCFKNFLWIVWDLSDARIDFIAYMSIDYFSTNYMNQESEKQASSSAGNLTRSFALVIKSLLLIYIFDAIFGVFLLARGMFEQNVDNYLLEIKMTTPNFSRAKCRQSLLQSVVLVDPLHVCDNWTD